MEENKSHTGLPKKISVAALLGLTDPEGVDWGRIRALQFEGLQENALLKTVASIVCGILAVQFGAGSVNPVFLGIWLATLFTFYLFVHFKLQKDAMWLRKTITRKETLAPHLIAGVGGLMWAIILFVYGMTAEPQVMLGLWSLVICLMVGSGMLMSTLPSVSLLYIILCGAGSAIGWNEASSLQMALVSIVITTMMGASCLMTGRSFVERKLAEATLNEKSETVSLLLREFEDTGADWLWQTDTSRRITHVSPRFAHAVGRDADELEGKPFLQMVAGQSWESGKFSSALA